MKYRDLTETALLLSWHAGRLPAVSHPPDIEGQTEFWRYVRFLEHRWHQELWNGSATSSRADEECRMSQELLAARLLVGALARVFDARDLAQSGLHRRQLDEHDHTVESLLDQCRRLQLSTSDLLRFRRLRQRLGDWRQLLLPARGPFLSRSMTRGREQVADTTARCTSHSQLLLTLRSEALSAAVSDREITDRTRREVYRSLLELAARFISQALFASTGRPLPPVAQRIAADAWRDSLSTSAADWTPISAR